MLDKAGSARCAHCHGGGAASPCPCCDALICPACLSDPSSCHGQMQMTRLDAPLRLLAVGRSGELGVALRVAGELRVVDLQHGTQTFLSVRLSARAPAPLFVGDREIIVAGDGPELTRASIGADATIATLPLGSRGPGGVRRARYSRVTRVTLSEDDSRLAVAQHDRLRLIDLKAWASYEQWWLGVAATALALHTRAGLIAATADELHLFTCGGGHAGRRKVPGIRWLGIDASWLVLITDDGLEVLEVDPERDLESWRTTACQRVALGGKPAMAALSGDGRLALTTRSGIAFYRLPDLLVREVATKAPHEEIDITLLRFVGDKLQLLAADRVGRVIRWPAVHWP